MMQQTLTSIRSWLESIDAQTFKKYVIGYLAGIVILCLLLGWYFYRSINSLHDEHEALNQTRESVHMLLHDTRQVKQQQAHINTMLKKDPDFKVAGIFQKIVENLGISSKMKEPTSAITERDENFSEDSITAPFVGLTMQHIAELLRELEKNERMYIKELTIIRSKKMANTLELTITVGTLLPKDSSATIMR